MRYLTESFSTQISRGLVLFFLVSPFLRAESVQAPQQIINLTTWGWSNQISDYYKEVVLATLERTKENYGPYQLKNVSRDINKARSIRDSDKKYEAHINFAAWRSQKEEEIALIEQYEISILLNILGLRKLIIRSEDQDRFSAIDSKRGLLAMKVGQRQMWPDNLIYRTSGFHVVNSDHYHTLYPMLQAKRFDILPLSIVEAESALTEQYNFLESLVVLDNHYIFYPFPIYVGISKQYPLVAQRILEGIVQLKTSGELENIFSKHFGIYVESIIPDGSKIFLLKNPSLNNEENLKAFDNILDTYFTPFSKTIYF